MKKYWKKFLGVGIASLLVLSACGDSGDSGSSDSSSSDITEDEDVELETY